MLQYGMLMDLLPSSIVAFLKPHRKDHHNKIDVLLLLLIGKLCICLHIVLETTISQHTLFILGLIVVIDMSIPQVVLVIFLSQKFISHLLSWCVRSFRVRANKVATVSCSGVVEGERQTLLA